MDTPPTPYLPVPAACLPADTHHHKNTPLSCITPHSASYKNKENIDLSKVAGFAHHEKDVGSTEVQIARLTARVEQMSSHLKANSKDHSGERGLQAVLAQRRKLLQYLYKKNR